MTLPETGTAETQDGNKERTETVAFRTTRVGKQLIAAAAEKRGELRSDWLRREVAHGLRRDLGIRAGLVEEGDGGSE